MKPLVALACICIIGATGYLAWKELGPQNSEDETCIDLQHQADAVLSRVHNGETVPDEELISLKKKLEDCYL